MIARTAPIGPSPRRFQPSGRSMNPSARIRSPWSRTRVATMTAKPASRAARATGSRCDQKNPSSATRNNSFGAASERAEGGATGSVECTRQPGTEKREARQILACLTHSRRERSRKGSGMAHRGARTPRQHARFTGKLTAPSPVAELSHRIAATIIIFRPERDQLLRLVGAIAADVERIFLFLNSMPPDGLIADCVAAAGSTPVETLGAGVNMGCAHVYNVTADAARDRGCDLLLQFDEDSDPPPGLPLREVHFLFSSGSLIDLDALAAIGPFREDFFTDGNEIEWCFRARARGFRCVMVFSEPMPHPLGLGQIRVPLLGIRLAKQPPVRLFTYARNQVAMMGLPLVPVWWK